MHMTYVWPKCKIWAKFNFNSILKNTLSKTLTLSIASTHYLEPELENLMGNNNLMIRLLLTIIID